MKQTPTTCLSSLGLLLVSFLVCLPTAETRQTDFKTCGGKRCLAGIRVENNKCRCCVDCSTLYRKPLPSQPCPAAGDECGECIESNYIKATNDPYCREKPQKMDAATEIDKPKTDEPPPAPPAKVAETTDHSPWPYVALGIVAFLGVSLYVGQKKVGANRRTKVATGQSNPDEDKTKSAELPLINLLENGPPKPPPASPFRDLLKPVAFDAEEKLLNIMASDSSFEPSAPPLNFTHDYGPSRDHGKEEARHTCAIPVLHHETTTLQEIEADQEAQNATVSGDELVFYGPLVSLRPESRNGHAARPVTMAVGDDAVDDVTRSASSDVHSTGSLSVAVPAAAVMACHSSPSMTKSDDSAGDKPFHRSTSYTETNFTTLGVDLKIWMEQGSRN